MKKINFIIMFILLIIGTKILANQKNSSPKEVLGGYIIVMEEFQDISDTTETFKELLLEILEYAEVINSLNLNEKLEIKDLVAIISHNERRISEVILPYSTQGSFALTISEQYTNFGKVYSNLHLQILVDIKRQDLDQMENSALNALGNISKEYQIIVEYVIAAKNIQRWPLHVPENYLEKIDTILQQIAHKSSQYYLVNTKNYPEAKKSLSILRYINSSIERSDIILIWNDLMSWPNSQLDLVTLEAARKFRYYVPNSYYEYKSFVERFFFLFKEDNANSYTLAHLIEVNPSVIEDLFSLLEGDDMNTDKRMIILNVLLLKEHGENWTNPPFWKEELKLSIGTLSSFSGDILRTLSSSSITSKERIIKYLETFDLSTSKIEFLLLKKIVDQKTDNVTKSLGNVSANCTDTSLNNFRDIRSICDSLPNDFFDLNAQNGRWIRELDQQIMLSSENIPDQASFLKEILFRDKTNASLPSAQKLYGINAELFQDMWDVSPSWNEDVSGASKRYRRDDLEGMYKLTLQAGDKAVENLFKWNNITHFGRYPVEHLVNNLRPRSDKPLLICMANKIDHNGAFAWRLIRTDLTNYFPIEKFDVRIMEPGNRKMAESLFLRTMDKIGLSRNARDMDKIEIFYFAFHGSPQGVRLKSSQDDQTIWNIWDKESIQNFQLFGQYAHRPDIVWNSCSTGDTTEISDPIAKISAKAMRGRSYGAAGDSYGINSIQVHYDTDSISVEGVTFSGPETNVFDFRNWKEEAIKDEVFDKEEMFSSITIFPNPTPEKVFIKLYQRTRFPIEIELFDIHGKKIKHKKEGSVMGENIYEVSLNNLSPGMYLLRVHGETHRIIKK